MLQLAEFLKEKPATPAPVDQGRFRAWKTVVPERELLNYFQPVSRGDSCQALSNLLTCFSCNHCRMWVKTRTVTMAASISVLSRNFWPVSPRNSSFAATLHKTQAVVLWSVRTLAPQCPTKVASFGERRKSCWIHTKIPEWSCTQSCKIRGRSQACYVYLDTTLLVPWSRSVPCRKRTHAHYMS